MPIWLQPLLREREDGLSTGTCVGDARGLDSFPKAALAVVASQFLVLTFVASFEQGGGGRGGQRSLLEAGNNLASLLSNPGFVAAAREV